jgi:8-oxo-dGTP diphosphatase
MTYRNPSPTADIIIELIDRPERPIVLVERQNEPFGWAIPGGFIDEGETVEQAARREALEETGLEVSLVELLGVYSDPERDPRKHTMSVVYIATATGAAIAGDDAKALQLFSPSDLPHPLCFDHAQILQDYLHYRYYGKRPAIV